jgi:hypothetical protein
VSEATTDNEWPPDCSREEETYARNREWLMRDHFGKIAVIHEDEVIGVFQTLGEAILEGYRCLGDAKKIFRKVGDPDGPEYWPWVDITDPCVKILKLHPSIRLVGKEPQEEHG